MKDRKVQKVNPEEMVFLVWEVYLDPKAILADLVPQEDLVIWVYLELLEIRVEMLPWDLHLDHVVFIL